MVYAKGRGGHGHQTPKIQLLHITESLWQLINDPSMADLIYPARLAFGCSVIQESLANANVKRATAVHV